MFHWFKKHTKDGHEIPDDTPIHIPLSDRPLNIQEQLARFVRSEEVKKLVQDRGIDTFDEADDFDIDEPEFRSPYEMVDMEDEVPVVQTRMDEIKSGMVKNQDRERVSKVFEKIAKKKADTKEAIGETKA